MTLPLYLVLPGSLDGVGPGDLLRLDGPEGRHAATVRRTRPGEQIQVADGLGRVVVGAVSAVAGDIVVLHVASAEDVPEPAPRFVLVQALAKNDRDDQAVEAATEIGVDEVVPWQAARCVVQWRGERGERAWRRWDSLLLAASKQSRRARRPLLGETATTADVVRRIEAGATAYILHEGATDPVASVDLPESGEVLLVVGPEGGITQAELEAFTGAGAHAVRLGSTVLRSSSAGPAALAVLSAMRRWR